MPAPADIPALASHAVPFALVVSRLSGVFLLAPTLSSAMIPQRHKAILVVMLAAAVYPGVAPGVAADAASAGVGVFDLLPLLLGEALLGLCVGAVAALPLLAMDMAGVVAGQSMGFGLARVYNPEAEVDTDLLGQLLFFIASGIFAACGGLERLLGVMIGSFDRVPIGGLSLRDAPARAFAGALASGFELALRVSLPVVGTTALLMIALGVIGKTMPQLNIMTVGFTLKILAGLGVLVFAGEAVADAAGVDITRALADAAAWIEHLPGDAPHGR